MILPFSKFIVGEMSPLFGRKFDKICSFNQITLYAKYIFLMADSHPN